uniref:Uncharacterized protein n=1 Tax=Timema douglasi TaxID=61478 RepID=A0A7R8VLB9_TIMDO|nr:unnamed protein product [Timema douglasi]
MLKMHLKSSSVAAVLVIAVMMRMRLWNVMAVVSQFMRAATVCLTRPVCRVQSRRAALNHGSVRLVEPASLTQPVNCVQTQVGSSKRQMWASGCTWCVLFTSLEWHLEKWTSCRV